MKTKDAVTISRHWHNPAIHTVVTVDGIKMSVSLDDFVAALTEELYGAGRWMTKSQLEQRVKAARSTIVERIKEESTKVV